MSKFSMILSEIILGYNLFFRSCIAVFMFISNLILDIIISLHSAILVPSNSFLCLGHYLLESCFSSASRICFSHPHFSALLIISWLNFGFEKLFHQCPHSFLLPVFCHYNFSHYLTNFDLKIL